MKTKNEKFIRNAAIIAAGGIAVLLWLYFCLTTVYSSDDYWYSTFWDNGLSGYWELMIYHYQTMNGRVLVHILAHAILHLGNWAFAAMCLTICIAVPAMAAKALGIGRNRIIAVVIFFLYGMLLMPQQILNQGVFWVSASCNYIFPSALICILAIALEKKQKWAWIAAFLSGATTEQMGLASVFLCGIYAVDAVIRKKKNGAYWASTAAAALGVLSVFASPATARRASEGVGINGIGKMFLTLRSGILREKAILTENPFPILVMVVLLAAMAFMIWEKTRKKGVWAIAAGGCAGLLAGCSGSEQLCWIGFSVAFVAMAALTLGLMGLGHRLSGALVLAGLFSAAVILPTNSVEPRVMTPACFLLLLCVCLLAADRGFWGKRPALVILVCAAATTVWLIPALKGYAYNYRIDRLNKQLASEAKQTGFIQYCTDYDMDYTWIKADHDPYFRIKYLESCGFPEHDRVIFFSQSDVYPHIIYYGEELLGDGVLTDEQGRVLLPLRQILTKLGGELVWEDGKTKISLDQREYILYDLDDRTARVSWIDDSGAQRQQDVAVCTYYTHKKYCEISFFTQILDIPVQLDQEQFCYRIPG